MTPMPSDFFARRLRTERERAEISQAELARRMAAVLGIKVDPSALTRIEQQQRAVRLDEAVAAAQALDLPLVMLLVEDPAAENQRRLHEYLTELAAAEGQWSRSRAEIDRLTVAIKALTDERIRLARAQPSTPPLDPELAEAIDARVPLDENEGRGWEREEPTWEDKN